MSKRSNVNPDHYKLAGRGRQGENIVHRDERQAFESERGGRRRRGRATEPRKKR